MTRFTLLGLTATASLAVALFIGGTAVDAKSVTYELPPETAAFRPGPNLETVQGNCGACHSADYIQTQPTGPKFKQAFWQVEVTKMIKLYGAPIEEADVPKIVDYLSTTY